MSTPSVLALVVAVALVAGPVSAAPSRNLADYVLLAGESLIARRLVVQGGDVGVSAGFVRSHNEIDGPQSRIAADLVDIDQKSRCIELAANDVIETGAACGPAGAFVGPLFTDLGAACGFPAAPPDCNPSRPVEVPHKTTQVLPPGVYGDLLVSGASPGRATLILEGGDYVFCNLHMGPRARMLLRAPATVHVAGKANHGVGTFTGPANGSGLGPEDLTLFVAGDEARLQLRADVVGRICAPNGLLRLMHGSRLEGQGVARRIRTGRATVSGAGSTGTTTTTTVGVPTTTSTSTTTTSTAGGSSSTSTSSTTIATTTTTSTSSPGPTTTSSTSTTTSIAGTSSTSTSSTSSTSAPGPSTSSTTSSSVATTSSSTTSSSIAGAVCGNGMTETGETCDDGNTVDGDFCPSNCAIAVCNNPQIGGALRNVDVTINATLGSGQKLGTVQVFLNYPESVVIIPGSADDSQVQGSISMTPSGASCIPNDLDYGMIQGCFAINGFNPGLFFRAGFVTCGGAPAPVAGDFTCTIREVTDQNAQVLSGVTCTVSLP